MYNKFKYFKHSLLYFFKGINMTIKHNLPNQPYKKFFGRVDSLEKIKETLLEGGTFIASIDGVGGIGKTALAYYFCKEYLTKQNCNYDYLIWLSAKNTVFDSYSTESQIKYVSNEFNGIEALINATLKVIDLPDLINQNIEEKKHFFEEDFIKTEKVFFILDNLETIEDDNFFKYITQTFNKYSGFNRYLKALTTSRKRKRLADFPIEIEGLSIEDALSMLKYYAKNATNKPINDILNANDHKNIALVEKVGRIPLGIEFIVGQMANGKTRGQIYHELEGYPSLENITNPEEKNKTLSDIILFSFKDMYETLDNKHQTVFKTIAALQKNKKDISIEVLMAVLGFSKNELDNIIEVLLDNKLILLIGENNYGMTPLAVNLVKRLFDDFAVIENDIIGITRGFTPTKSANDRIDIILESLNNLKDKNDYDQAENFLINALDISSDYRLYYELAKVQEILNKYSKASDNYEKATELCPNNEKVWFDWINMEDKQKRRHIALDLIEKALEKTNNHLSIVKQQMNIHKVKKEFETARKKVEHFCLYYEASQRREDLKNLLNYWKNIEFTLLKNKDNNNYFYFIDYLLKNEDDILKKLPLLNEKLNAAKRFRSDQIKNTERLIKNIELRVKNSVSTHAKEMNRLFNLKQYEEAKKEARVILNWADEENDLECKKNALRVLLQILASENDYNRIIMTFEDYKNIGYQDKNSEDTYNRAIKEIKQKEKDEIIKDISLNIQNAENEIRNIIIFTFDQDESSFLERIKPKTNEIKEKYDKDWIEQWNFTRDKALKKDEFIIFYSDLSQIRDILIWVKKEIASKANDNRTQKKLEDKIKKLVAFLQDYTSKDRNETFHSRLQLYEKDKLDDILVNSRRLIEIINDLKIDLEII